MPNTSTPPEITDLLLPYEELPDITDSDWDASAVPHILARKGEAGQSLLFVGLVHHSEPDPADRHYMVAKLACEVFFEQPMQGHERKLVVEGLIREPARTAEDSYRLGSEATLAAFYAQQHGVGQFCFEPQTADIAGLGLPEDYRKAYVLARDAPTHKMRAAAGKVASDFGEYTNGRLPRISREFGWESNTTYDDMLIAYERACGEPFNYDDTEKHYHEAIGYMLDPGDSPVMQTSAAINRQLRDPLLAAGIAGLWRQGADQFVPFGLPHLLTLAPYLQTLGEPAEQRLLEPFSEMGAVILD